MRDYTGEDAAYEHSKSEWFKALINSPDDATLRGAYADWLDENGYHQRAERQREIAEGLRNGTNTTRTGKTN